MNNILLGIDPGKQGAVAFFTIHLGKLISVTARIMPLAGKSIDLPNLSASIYEPLSKGDDVVACIEKVGAMPGQGVTSMFTFGFGTGAIHGILAAYDIPTHIVTPQAWKKHILAGTTKDKDAAIAYCARVYPKVNLVPDGCRKPSSGIADAICIATYLMTVIL